MMQRIYTVEELNKRLKKAEIKARFKRGFDNVKNWVMDNKDFILFFSPTIIGITGFGIKTISKNVRLKKEKDLKELYCYDRSLGHYWRLRRELSNREWVEIDQRKKSGERLADILSEMKVLK